MQMHSQSGFTLIEMVMAIVIIAIIGVTGATTLSNSVLAWREAPDVVDTLSKLRGSLERVEREVREMRRDPLTPANYDVTLLTASQLDFTKSDGTNVIFTIAPPTVNIEYSTPAVASVLVDQVNTAVFTFFQQDGTTSATGGADLAFVELQLELTESGNSYAQMIRVALRNQP